MASHSRAQNIERYRAATEDTLRQLDLCIAYFRRIRRSEIANSIDRNRRSIQDRLNRSRGGSGD